MKEMAPKERSHPRRTPPVPAARRAPAPAALPAIRPWNIGGFPIFPNPIPAGTIVVAKDDARETNAENVRSARAAARETRLPAWLPAETGVPLALQVRRAAEQRYGADFSGVRVHDTDRARMSAAAFGARAFTTGSHVYLGPSASQRDEPLMLHELAHVLQANGDAVCLRSATWLERRAWLSFFDHYLPQKFLNNYMDDTGALITLTQQEMIDCNPIVDLHRSTAFTAEVAALQKAGGGTKTIAVSGWGGALTNGTLGNFTIHYQGKLHVDASGTWDFNGAMDFYDYWDFDPKPFGSGSGRPVPAEVKVRVADKFLPGQPFAIKSVSTPVSQTSADSAATWAGAKPHAVGDKATRTGADITGGAEVGASGGPDTEAGGGEVGAQSSKDLQKK
jgi:hypothetical protein